MESLPLPGHGDAETLVTAPAPGPGNWAGAPSAAADPGGGFLLAYRVRSAQERGSSVVLARHVPGRPLERLAEISKQRFGAASLERPALVRTPTGAWRLYLSCATPGTKHWWIVALEADDPTSLTEAEPVTAFPGDPTRTAVKDPVVWRDAHGWHAWVCCHPLDSPGHEDRMTSRRATSADGLTWAWEAAVLRGRPGAWDARGVRVTARLGGGWLAYDGRASAEENFSERTGVVAAPTGEGHPAGDPVSVGRYLTVVPLASGGHRLYVEFPLPDGSHELRTEGLGPPSST